MRKVVISLLVLLGLNALLISAITQAKSGWDIPESYKTKKNAIKSSAASIDEGKELWNKNCKSCHGSTGAGDGVKAKNLGKSCGNFTTAEFQSQLTDGGIYYLSYVKQIDEHGFDKKLPDDMDRWNIVNYIRTFKK